MVEPDQAVCHVVLLIYTNFDISARVTGSCWFLCVAFIPHDVGRL